MSGNAPPTLRPFTPLVSTIHHHQGRRGSAPSNFPLPAASSPSIPTAVPQPQTSQPISLHSQSLSNASDPSFTSKRRLSSIPVRHIPLEEPDPNGYLSAYRRPLPLLRSPGPPSSSPRRTPNVLPRQPRELLNMVSGLVKNRQGSVLSRNLILKADHFPAGMNPNLDFHLQGAPNFRMVDLNVFGVAQPTTIGLSTILAVLNCHPKSISQASCIWFSTREEPLIYLNGYPYVLRDYAQPQHNIRAYLGIRANRLEQMEERLKDDVVKEAARIGGLLLVHQEMYDGSVVPCWITADEVQTPREVFGSFLASGHRVHYFRIPISPEQASEDDYLDEYVRVIRDLSPADPLVFNCGMGVVRTTFGMIVAQIIRRAQIIDQGIPDPFPIFGWQYPSPRPRAASFTGTTAMNANENGNGNAEQWRGLEEAEETRAQNKALLRLVYVLERGLDSKMSPRSAVEWALARGNLIDNLKNAILGNYQWITGLVSVLESGTYSKKLLDVVIDRCDALINIREDILMNRVRHTSSSDTVYLSKALVGLERYFFLLSFTSYVNESPDSRFEVPFSRWVKQRTEIWTMLENLRRKGPQLYLFRPVDDLSKLSGGKEKGRAGIGAGDGWGSMFGTGREIAGELERFVVKNRTGTVLGADTILKIDHWRNEEAVTPSASEPDMKQLQQTSPFFIEGATNFRRIRRTHVYGVAQPTFAGAERVIAAMRRDWSRNRNVVWINLREEPIIYINGQPYVLRDNQHTLRNIRAYSGITASRLELLEQRLKDDVLKELEQYDGRMLLHAEVGNGTVPVWEDVRPEDVLTVREVMDKVKEEVARGRINTQVEAEIESGESEEVGPVELNYYRIPVTAEGAPVYKDFDDLRHLMGQVDWSTTGLVVNCQVGLGRSTTGTVIATLITHWLQGLRTPKMPWADGQNQFQLPPPNQGMEVNYQIINSLLRVIKNGLECKRLVDEIVDDCAVYLNLRDCIEDFRLHAENAADETIKRRAVKRGLAALERYFLLICFQSYLDQMDADTAGDLESFQAWMARHQEFDTILQELERDGMESLVPVEKLNPGDGIALTSEVLSVVNQRKGQVLALQTILKHDAFPGCQKMSLREKVEGAPNYRRVPLALVKSAVSMNGGVTLSEIANPMTEDLDEILEPPFVCGCAMPTKDAVVSVLKKMNAGPGGKRKVFWTCLREEPVVYVNKRPFVLRLFMDPLKNLETTGIARHRVENMERKLKEDILAEIRQYEGRVLLHDEELLDKGGYSIVPIWETVNPEDIVTPCDVFDSIKAEGYQVDFFRIPITDEQAPIPIVFDQIISRLKGVDGTIDVLFNCQMGRGRTTTGMVIACLMGMILNNDAALDMAGSYIVDDSSVPFSVEEETTSFSDDTEAEKYNSRNRYLNGEYKIILQLVGVLTFGKLAKRRTDQAIDLCEHMQNLRKAIYDYKLRVEGTETTGTRMWLGLREVGLNYLIRYFYLIVFADYLLEEMSGGMDGGETDDDFSDDEAMKPFRATKRVAGQRKVLSFSEWLAERREITNIIRVANQDFS